MADFVWPEPTDEQLEALLNRPDTGYVEGMRDAIALARRLDAGIDPKAACEAWEASYKHHAMSFSQWLFTHSGTVEPLPPPVPTLAEAREAARLLAGPAAEIVTRYLESQEGQADG